MLKESLKLEIQEEIVFGMSLFEISEKYDVPYEQVAEIAEDFLEGVI